MTLFQEDAGAMQIAEHPAKRQTDGNLDSHGYAGLRTDDKYDKHVDRQEIPDGDRRPHVRMVAATRREG